MRKRAGERLVAKSAQQPIHTTTPRTPTPTTTSWFHPFTCKRFHVLLNSLFKVLCNFPSRYLFAIGLAVIFSLTRSLPRALLCTFKHSDSYIEMVVGGKSRRYGSGTHFGTPFEGTCNKTHHRLNPPQLTWHPSFTRESGRGFTLDCSPFVRHYSGNPFWFLFLRLVICLSSAGSLT